MTDADAEKQIRQSRAWRQDLALMRCQCGACDERDVYPCEWCDRFQPACLLAFAPNHEAVCLKKECRK